MGKLFIHGMRLTTIIGELPYERNHPQDIILDLELLLDTRPAAHTDQLCDTVSYVQVYQFLQEYIPTTQFHLLEALATKTAEEILSKFNVSGIKLRITKNPIDMPNCEGAGIEVSIPALSNRQA